MATDTAVTLEKAVEDVLGPFLEEVLPRAIEKCGGLAPASEEQKQVLMDWGRKVALLKLEYLKHDRLGDKAARAKAQAEIAKALGEGKSLLKDSKMDVVVARVARATTLASREAFTRAQVKAVG